MGLLPRPGRQRLEQVACVPSRGMYDLSHGVGCCMRDIRKQYALCHSVTSADLSAFSSLSSVASVLASRSSLSLCAGAACRKGDISCAAEHIEGLDLTAAGMNTALKRPSSPVPMYAKGGQPSV